MARAVIRRKLTAEARVRSRVYVRYLTKNRGVAPRTLALPCQRHSAIAPNLSLSICYFIQDNRAKHGKLNKELLFQKQANISYYTRVPS